MPEVRVEDLIGREVYAHNNRRVGRLEEFRADVCDGACVVSHCVIGAAGLFERLDLGARRILGLRTHGYLARWNQMDISDPARPRITCPVDDLERL